MGLLVTKLIFNEIDESINICMVGLPFGGKSTILKKLSPGTFSSYKIQGVSIERCNIGNYWIHSWNLELKCRFNLNSVKGIIFVVDSSDRDRKICQAKMKLLEFLKQYGFNDLPILVYANKQDYNKNRPKDLIKKMELKSFPTQQWKMQGIRAINGLGIGEGFDWLKEQLPQKALFL